VNTLVGGAQFMFESVKVAAGIDKFSDYSIKVVRGDTLFINGYIAYGITEQIDGVFEQNPDLKTVSFYSLGGRVKPARHIRDLIEQKKLNTYSRSVCLSLCTYTFLAGQKRIVNVGTKIGFHGVAFPGLTDSDLKVQSKEFISYFRERGVPSEFAQKAFSTPPEDMWYPSYQELMEANFITHVRVYKKLIPVAKFCKKIDCSKSSDAPQWLQLEAAFNNLDLPQMIDGVTRLDSVVAGPGRNLTFQYVILDTEGAYSELIAQNLESFACKKETIQRYFEKEVNLHFLYLDKSGEQWFKKSIGSSTCESSLSTE